MGRLELWMITWMEKMADWIWNRWVKAGAAGLVFETCKCGFPRPLATPSLPPWCVLGSTEHLIQPPDSPNPLSQFLQETEGGL